MIKYRRLSSDELKELEPEFITFLASKSITASEWKHLKKNESDQVDNLIDQFSTLILEKVYKDTRFLSIQQPDQYLIFKMESDQAEMHGLRFSKPLPKRLLNTLISDLLQDPVIYKKYQPQRLYFIKKYTKSKAEEVDFLIKQGAVLTDEVFFNWLSEL